MNTFDRHAYSYSVHTIYDKQNEVTTIREIQKEEKRTPPPKKNNTQTDKTEQKSKKDRKKYFKYTWKTNNLLA